MLAVALAAPANPQAGDRRADQVIARAVAAMGGLDNIHDLHSLAMKGFHYEGSYHQEYSSPQNSKAAMIRMRPNLRIVGCRPEVIECNGKWGGIVEGFDGTRGWELNWPKQRLVRTVNKAEWALHCGAEFDPLFVDYKARGFKATYLGEQTLLGTRAIAVTITPPECAAETFYFDPKSYALLMKRAALPVHARGDAVDTVQVIREFKTVAGVKIPSRSEEVALNDGHVLDGGGWTSIEANTITNRRVFEAPEVHPAGTTALVLRMLDAAPKSSPEALLAMYDDFRKAPEGAAADTNYDMNWLGYELLKVDNYPAALAIFQRLVTEHPNSANAYDSLGDAYLQQGDKVRALAAFEKALSLDPKLEDTQRKRNELRARS
jgi:hypothetical protein